jgi:hypothetical protein
MMDMLKNWIKNRFTTEASAAPPRTTASYRQRVTKASPAAAKTASATPDLEPHLQGSIESLGPGKNVYVRSHYVREDTGTHETLKIIDESLLDSDDQGGFDPYNTGRFDRSKKWDSRSRK